MKKIIVIMICILSSIVYSVEIPKDIKGIFRSNERANAYIVNLKGVKNESVRKAFERMVIVGKYMQENYPEANFLQIFIDDDNYLGITINSRQLNLADREINVEVLEEARNKTYKHMSEAALEQLCED